MDHIPQELLILYGIDDYSQHLTTVQESNH